MTILNFAQREILCKVVYYGPGLGGKTTNLRYIHSRVPEKYRGNLTSVETQKDRTLFFDLLPIEYGKFRGFTIRMQLYTVPGQVFYNTSRKIVLKGVDGVVFVTDSQAERLADNVESLKNLNDNLRDIGLNPASIPMVLQFNKRDLERIYSTSQLNKVLNYRNFEVYEAVAVVGQGVFNTLKGISNLVVKDIRRRYDVDLKSIESRQIPLVKVAPEPAARAPARAPEPAIIHPKPEVSAPAAPVRETPVKAEPKVPIEASVEAASDSDDTGQAEKPRGRVRNVLSALFKWARKK